MLVLLTPVLVRELGPTAYGAWVVVYAFSVGSGYASLLDLGIPGSVAKHVAEMHARGEPRRARQVAGAALFGLTGVGFVGGGLLLLVGWLCVRGPLAPDDPAIARAMIGLFGLLALETALELPSQVFSGVIVGRQRYDILRVLDVVRMSVFAAFALRAAWWLEPAGAVVGLGVGAVAATAITLVGRAVVAVGLLGGPPARGAPAALIRRVLGLSAALLVARTTTVLFRQTDKLLVGALLATAALTELDVAAKVQSVVLVVPSVLASAVLPAASELAAIRDADRLRILLVRGTKVVLTATLPLATVVFCLADPLVEAWIGAGWGARIGPLARIAVASTALAAAFPVGIAMAGGAGSLGRLTPWMLASLAVNVGATVALLPSLGVAGAFWGTLAGHALAFPAYLWFFGRDVGAGLRRIARELGLVYVCAAVHGAAVWALVRATGPEGLVELAVAGALALVLWLPLALGVCVRGEERRATLRAIVGG